MYIFFVSVILLNIIFIYAAKDCEIDISRDFPVGKEQRLAPLLIDPTSTLDDKIFYADKNYKVKLKDGQKIDFVCVDVTWNSKCVDGKFQKGTTTKPFKDFECTKDMQYTAVFTKKVCKNNFDEFQVGFDTKGKLIPMLTGCFDSKNKITKYVTFKMTKSVNQRQECSRPSTWQYKDIYTSLPDYSTISKITDKELGVKMAIGHLTAFQDLPYCQQQKDTFHLANAVPQCSSCNSGSWLSVEKYIRDKVENGAQAYQDVYVGSHEIISLKTTPDVPVPKYVFKVLPFLGHAFIGKNHKSMPKFCTDVCTKFTDLKLTDLGKEFIFCCEISDFKEYVDFLPIKLK